MKLYDTIKYVAIGAVALIAGGCNGEPEQPEKRPVSEAAPLEKKTANVPVKTADENTRYNSETGVTLHLAGNGRRFHFGDYQTNSGGIEPVEWLIRYELGQRGLKSIEDLAKDERSGFLNSIGKKMDKNGDLFIHWTEAHAYTDPIHDALEKKDE